MSMLHTVSPRSSASAAERVYGEVKELILTNGIAGGELISEGEIATRCAVSRTPVREAFLRLETEGWMRLYPKRGALVVPIGDREAADVIDARKLLEGHAVRSLARHPEEARDLVGRLHEILDTHRAADPKDISQFARLDAQFHQLIAAAGDNALLTGFFATLGERHRRMTTVSVNRNPGMPDRILADHDGLVAAIDSGDVELFDTLLDRHLAEVHNVAGDR